MKAIDWSTVAARDQDIGGFTITIQISVQIASMTNAQP